MHQSNGYYDLTPENLKRSRADPAKINDINDH